MGRRAALVLLLVLLGGALRLWQYASGTALWVDEVAIANNVLQHSVGELLTRPLDYEQQAAPGFLFLEKVAVSVLGPSDWALRLFPLLGSLVALLAFWRVAERLLTGAALTLAMGLFALAAPLILYSAQVKQYSTDVAATALLLWLGADFDQRGASGRRAWVAGAAGAAAVWFSQTALVVLCGVGAFLLFRRRAGIALVPVLGSWALSAAAATAVALAGNAPPTRAFLRQFWAAGFPPVSGGPTLQIAWPFHQMLDLLGNGRAALGYPLPQLYLALAAAGLLLLWWRQGSRVLLLALPLLVALLLAVTRQLPFTGRLIVYLLPIFFVSVAYAVEEVGRRGSAALGYGAICLVAAGAVYPVVTTPPPYRVEDIKTGLHDLRANQEPGDRTYVYYGARPAAAYYGAANDVLGGCHRSEPRRYLEELDGLRGQSRVWILISHAIPAYGERDIIVGYLDRIGERRASFIVPSHTVGTQLPGVEVLLYDLADPVRLSNASSASYPLPPSQVIPALGCDHGTWLMLQPATHGSP